jgi:hypothetical protein
LSTGTEFVDEPRNVDIQESNSFSRSHNCLGVSLKIGAAIDDGAINAVRETMTRMAIAFRMAFRARFEWVMTEVLIEVEPLATSESRAFLIRTRPAHSSEQMFSFTGVVLSSEITDDRAVLFGDG